MRGGRVSLLGDGTEIITGSGDDEAASDVRISFFGVYDGHGGDKVAIYTDENLHKIIAKQEAFKNKNFETTWTRARRRRWTTVILRSKLRRARRRAASSRVALLLRAIE